MLLECVDITRELKPINLYMVSATEFQKIPGFPIAYWVKPAIFDLFLKEKTIDEIAPPRIGMMTTDNNRFLRFWYEISIRRIGFHHSSIADAITSETKWFPYNKGGNYRKWAGNYELVVNWYKGGQEIMDAGMTSFRGKDFYFRKGITWGDISTDIFSCRYTNSGRMFDIKGTSCFPSEKDLPIILSVLNSKVGSYILNFLNPTITFQSGDIRRVPIPYNALSAGLMTKPAERLINLSTDDWDSYETSWSFTESPLMKTEYRISALDITYKNLRAYYHKITVETLNLEEEINRILITAYSLDGELAPEMSLEQVTLTCNPYFRYDNNKSEKELEVIFCADTMKEFISYSVGCMFGRYSLDKPGLILANQGETMDDFRLQIADYGVPWEEVRFKPDEDNAIPLLEGEWFPDDIAGRFKKFLRVTFGDEHFDENLAFIEDALGRDIRSYFFKDFYNEHVKMYKKRPIYWLFSSAKGSFNVLIYMHRYRPDTLSVILNGYLRAYREKLLGHQAYLDQIAANPHASKSDQAKAIKESDQLNKVLAELKQYENEVLYPLATRRVEIDLDDGVKVNYAKFEGAVKRIVGL